MKDRMKQSENVCFEIKSSIQKDRLLPKRWGETTKATVSARKLRWHGQPGR